MSEFTKEEILEGLLHFCEEAGVSNIAGIVEGADDDDRAILVQFKVSIHDSVEDATNALEITPDEEVPHGQVH